MTAKVKQNQTLFDIAIINFDDSNIAFEIARINDISISATLEAGSEIILPDYPTVEKTKYIDVATGTTLDDGYFSENISAIVTRQAMTKILAPDIFIERIQVSRNKNITSNR